MISEPSLSSVFNRSEIKGPVVPMAGERHVNRGNEAEEKWVGVLEKERRVASTFCRLFAGCQHVGFGKEDWIFVSFGLLGNGSWSRTAHRDVLPFYD